VDLILEHHVYYFRYLLYFIQSVIDIIYRYGPEKPMSIEIILFHKTLVDKNSGSFRVDQSIYQEISRDVYSLEEDGEV